MGNSVLRRSAMLRVATIFSSIAAFGFAGQAQAAVYAGNGATGFGGPVGQGSLAVTDNGAGNVTFAFTPSAGHPSGLDGNNLVIYLSTGAAGLTDTQSLTDTGTPHGSDNGHTAISGYNNFNNGGDVTPSRTVIAFPTGFQATYAFSFANAYDGLFQLPTDNSGNLAYITGAAPVANNNTLTMPLSTIGLTQGQSFSLVATYLDGSSAYRSNETIGDALINGTATSLTAVGNPGFNNLITFTTSRTYSTTAVPEPGSLAVLTIGGLMAGRRRGSR
ncbi:MAG: hypothetical protein JWM57_607 [Phycisphaerales bacterium]|nr:hypothetical protein [Phycisphaerales bacterium]